MTDQSRLQLTDALIERMLAQRAGPGAPADLIPSVTAAIESTSQRAPGVLGTLRGPAGSRTRRGPGRTWLLAAAALLLVGGAMAVGSGLVRLPSLVPPVPAPTAPVAVASPTAGPTIAPSPSPTASPRPAALIAFIWRMNDRGNSMAGTARIWLAAADGSVLRELIPGGTGNQSGVAWSPDGSHLIYAENGSLYVTDVAGIAPQRLDTTCSPEFKDADPAFSPDGTRIVFRRGCTSRIATMDLASGQVSDLESTAGLNGDRPRFSPDGTQIAFSTSYKSKGGPDAYIVDADGQNLRKLTTPALPGRYPEWSPDGSRIVITSYLSTILGTGGNRYEQVKQDVYTVLPDGSDLQRLTTDGISVGAAWTSDGRILFGRLTQDAQADGGLWTMNADGSGIERVFSGPTELTSEMYVGHAAEWQPTP